MYTHGAASGNVIDNFDMLSDVTIGNWTLLLPPNGGSYVFYYMLDDGYTSSACVSVTLEQVDSLSPHLANSSLISLLASAVCVVSSVPANLSVMNAVFSLFVKDVSSIFFTHSLHTPLVFALI